MTTISWFSAGVSSAVATKLIIDQIDRIIYTHIDDQHEDTMRFVKDCEQWFGKEVEILQSPLKSVEGACMKARYVKGVAGAACTRMLKREVRMKWEYEQPLDAKLRYVWGMDCDEIYRLDDPDRGLRVKMPNQQHVCPLIDLRMTKEMAHEVLSASGIKRPAMYELGYLNNNCKGCLKGGMGYWNKTRRDFPEVFEQRAKMERDIGATCLKETDGTRIYLDELDPERGRNEPPIVGNCGILCEVMAL